MRIFIFLFVTTSFTIGFSSSYGQDYYSQMDRFLEKYHNENGLIDYVDIGKNDATLDSLYTAIGAMNLADRDESFLKAFYINAYNTIVIKQVVVFYPIEKPFDVTGFFDNIKNTVSGKEYTLDELEKTIITPRFKDPRIHFALVCAAKGCPPIEEKAFRPETVDEELDRITRQVLNDPYFVRVKGDAVYLTKVFDWYGDEFKEGGSIISYINQYRDEPIPEKSKIKFNEYDWMLNDYQSSAEE
ncbi:MAG: DUF547 domain-containing protein [Cyclobacteriaceae bacterium]